MNSKEIGSSLEVNENTDHQSAVMSRTATVMKTTFEARQQNKETIREENYQQTIRHDKTRADQVGDNTFSQESFIINSKEYDCYHFQEQIKDVTHFTSDIIRAKNLQIKSKNLVEKESDEDVLKFVGDGFDTKENSTQLRIYYNNCNGVEIHKLALSKMRLNKVKRTKRFSGEMLLDTKAEQMMYQLFEWNANIICLGETNVAWEKKPARILLQNITRTFDKEASWITTSSHTACRTLYKPGGVGMIIDGKWSGRTTERGRDWRSLGRWVTTTIKGKNDKKLTIFTCYKCPDMNLKHAGYTTVYMQQYTLLREQGEKNPNPGREFYKDLKNSVSEYIAEGHEVLILIDANEEWKKSSRIYKFAQTVGLLNTATEMFESLPPTFPRSGKTIDYALVTPDLLEMVTSFTMVPYNKDILGDHRGFVIEIDKKKLFCETSLENEVMTKRKLHTGDIKTCEKYIKKLEKAMTYHKVFERMESLCTNLAGKNKATKRDIIEYEKIYRDVHRLCRNAERTSKKSRSGNVAWSPKVTEVVYICRYWQMRMARFKIGDLTGHCLKGVKESLGIEDVASTEKEIEYQIKEAKKAKKEVFEKAEDYRVAFLQEKAVEYAKENKLTQEKAITEILLNEEEREVFQLLRQGINAKEKSKLDKIWVCKDNTIQSKSKYHVENRVEVTITEKIHEHLLKRNSDHLHQAKRTPFAKGEFREVLGETGDTPEAKLILNNAWTQTSAKTWLRKFVQGLQYDPRARINGVGANMSNEEYANFWKKKRENTTTSPHGLHVGHYKVACKNTDIIEVHRKLAQLPFQYRFAPEGWCQSVQLMLQKDPGKPWLHRLRIIELLDANMNAALMILIGRRLVYNAKQNDIIHPSAFGSVPGRTAQGALIQKKLVIDITKQTKQGGALFECDATGCYDRILPALQTVITRRVGLHENIALTMAMILVNMKRRVGTRFGISKKFIKSKKMKQLFGIGQGSGGGPAVWLMHLIVLFQLLEKQCKIPKFSNPTGEINHKTGGTGFVDDCNLAVLTRGNSKNEKMVMRNLRKNTQAWERNLYATGGKLELSKCFWILILWKWIGGEAKLVTKKQLELKLKLKQSESKGKKYTIVRRNDVHEGDKVLGVRMTVAGNWNEEVQMWIGKSACFAAAIKKSKFPRKCGIKIYPFLWVPKFRYSASIIGYTRNQCNQIQRQVVRECLAASGLSRQFPRTVCFGPKRYGGLGWEKLRSVQIYEHVLLLLRHLKMEDGVSKLMKIALDNQQLLSGISKPILESTVDIYYVEDNWIMTLRKLIIEAGIQLRIHGLFKIRPTRENDMSIMECFLEHYNKKEMKMLNSCRLYLQASTVADIVSYDGKDIDISAWTVESPTRKTKLKWPIQERPSAKAIRLWQSALQLIATGRKLKHPLGNWKHDDHQYLHYFQLQNIKNNPREDQIAHSIEEYTDGCPQHIKQVIGQYEITEISKVLKAKWTQDQIMLIAATDGGLKSNIGSHAYAIYLHEEKLAYGGNAEEPQQVRITSTREELLGMLGVLYIMQGFISIWGRPAKTIKLNIVTDSKSAIDIRTRYKSDYVPDNYMLLPEMDVEGEIKRVADETNLDITYTWIESHTSDTAGVDPFYWKINNDVDEKCTLLRQKVVRNLIAPVVYDMFPGTIAAVIVDGEIIHNRMKEIIYAKADRNELEEFMKEKYEWDDTTMRNVNWTAHERAIKSTRPLHLVNVLKLIHGWQCVNSRKKYMYKARDMGRRFDNVNKQYSTGQCSSCKEEETRFHYFQCTAIAMKKAWRRCWRQFRKSMKNHTDERIFRHMWVGLQSFVCKEFPQYGPAEDDYCEDFFSAYDTQTDIGWANLLMGRISSEWGKLNTKLLQNRTYEVDDTTWTTRCVKNLWSLSLSLWEFRNQQEHGSDKNMSRAEHDMANALIKYMYDVVKPLVLEQDKWLFQQHEKLKLSANYDTKIAWLDTVRRVCRYLENSKSEGIIGDADVRAYCLISSYDML